MSEELWAKMALKNFGPQIVITALLGWFLWSEIKGLEGEIKDEIGDLSSELRTDINRINDRIDRHIESVKHSSSDAKVDSQNTSVSFLYGLPKMPRTWKEYEIPKTPKMPRTWKKYWSERKPKIPRTWKEIAVSGD